MSESKRSPVKRIAIIGAVAVAAIVLVVSAAGLSALLFLPDSADQRSASRDNAQDNNRVGRDQDGPWPASLDAGRPWGIPVAQEEAVQMVDIVTNPRIISFDNPGESQQLKVQGFYSDGSVGELADLQGAQPSFASSEPGAVQVDSAGVVTGLEIGGADIVVRYGEHATEVPVLVWGPVRQMPPIDPERVLEIDDDGSAIVLNRVMARLSPGYGPAEAARIAASIGGEVVFEFRTFPGYVIDFGAQTEEDLHEALAVIEADDRVEYAYPDMLAPPSQGAPSSPSPPEDTIGIREAWEAIGNWKANGETSRVLEPVVIVVMDMGFPSYDCLEDRKENYGDIYEKMDAAFDWDRIELKHDPNPMKCEQDLKSLLNGSPEEGPPHGVAVTSVLVSDDASDKGVVTGVSEIDYSLVFFSITATSWLENPFNTAPSKAASSLFNLYNSLEALEPHKYQIDVVNMSILFKHLSGGANDIVDLFGKMPDVTFVTGAGNDGKGIEDKWKPASASKTNDNVITVGGVSWMSNSADMEVIGRDPQSNYGDAVNLAAPFSVWAFNTRNALRNGYSSLSGTSFSAPLVSGTVALMQALDPELTPSEIKQILRDTGTEITIDTGDTWKVLNAEAAVKYVLDTLPTAPPRPDPTRVAQDRATLAAMTPTPTPTVAPTPTANPEVAQTYMPTTRPACEDIHAMLVPSGRSLDQYGSELPKIQLPYIEAPLIKHTLSPKSFDDSSLLIDPSMETRVEKAMGGRGIYAVDWILTFDTTDASMDKYLPFLAQVMDVTDPNEIRAVGSGHSHSVYQGVDQASYLFQLDGYGFERYKEYLDSDDRGIEQLLWKPGCYVVFLVVKRLGQDDEILLYLSFEITGARNIDLDKHGSELPSIPNIQVPGIEAPLVSHSLLPGLYNSYTLFNYVGQLYEVPVVKRMVGRELLTMHLKLRFDITHAPMDFQLPGYVRWVDVTDPHHPVVLSGSESSVYERGESFGNSYFEYVASRGTGEEGFWKPGNYQVQLVSNDGEVLLYLNFEVI